MTDTRPEPRPRLHTRNVEVVNYAGAIIAGFWQYGKLGWGEFYRCLTTFVVAREEWTIFQFDPTAEKPGASCPRGPEIVRPGRYILLSTAGAPITVGLVPNLARPRNQTATTDNAPNGEHHYVTRGHARDRKCLITGLESNTFSRLIVAHIFPRTHEAEWVRNGYPSRITDLSFMGGPTKIDSIQNLITLRRDLCNAWDNYEFGVDPDTFFCAQNDYRITAFTSGNADIDGLYLQLDHIDDPNHRPLDGLFIDHFMQGILRYMKGSAEPEWTYEDYDEVFGDGSFDASNPKIWGTRKGRESFELMLADRLFDHRVSQESELTAS